jgi:hypothetical protein
MSLYTTAQAESSFILASNLDSSPTEFAVRAGLTSSAASFGTITQNASSLTGNASYDFSSNGSVLHQWSGSNSTRSIIQEAVFKKSSAPTSGSSVLISSAGIKIEIQTNGTIRGFFRNAFNQTLNIASTANVCDGNWHHVVLAWNQGNDAITGNIISIFRLYIDGVLIGDAGSGVSEFGVSYGAYILVGGEYNSTATTRLNHFNGTIDFAAFYLPGTTFTAAQADTFVANHVASYADKTVTADPATASGLAVQPTVTIIRNIDVAADPATASATFPEALQNDIDLPLLLNQYMQSLATAGHLEQWYKFDEYKNVINYGNGGSSGFSFTGNADNPLQSGVQLNGALAVTGSLNDGNVVANVGDLAAGNTEFSDSNYVAGIWIKTPSSITSGRRDIWSASSSNGRGPSVSTGGNAGDNSIRFTVTTSNGEHQLIGTTNVMDGNWHFVACKQNDHAMELFIDGSSQGTLTATGSLMGTVTEVGFGRNNVTAFGGDKLLLSNFFVGNTTNITNTVITNIYNAGKDQLQGTAFMLQPAFKNNSAFNDYIESESPLIDFRFNESTGTPSSFGSVSLTPSIGGSSYLLGEPAIDGKAIKFTNRDTTFKASYSLDSGTVSTDDKVTMGVLFKSNTISLAHPLMGFGGFVVNTAPAAGIGMTLLMNTNGTLAVRSGNADGTFATNTGSVNYGDSNWHLAIVVQDTSNLLLYVDGKLEFTATRSTAFTDSGEFAVAGFPGVASGGNANLVKFIDNAFVTAGAFTANEAFDAWQALRLVMDTTATAAFPMPAVEAGFGPTVTADVSTATAFLPNVFPFIAPATASGLFQMPNFLAQKVVSIVADPMTASAQGENPGWDIGENNQVLHMDASATFPQPLLLIPGFWFANPAIANPAEMVQPAVVTTLGALIKPQSLNASAFAPLPPQYFTILDDLWYQRLVAIDEKDDIDGRSIVFFNTSNNFYVGSDPIPGSGWTAPLAVGKAAINAVTTPLPAINGGFFDAQNRKAVNLRNIAVTSGYTRGNIGVGERDFTFEAMIRTTKSNQVLFVGENDNFYNFQRTGIILRDGKLALTYSKDSRSGSVSANDQYLAFTGFKNIADGEWHHIIIQNKEGRNQFWIDGQLDIQRYGNTMYVINRVGYNSPELNSYSDFTISAFGLNLFALVEQSEINLNYLAAINVVPVKAGVATATVTATPNTKGRGNRGRALMLYFWPTQNYSTGIYKSRPERSTGLSGETSQNYHDYDQGGYGTNPDTFYQLSTYTTNGAAKFYDWDIWPVPVVKFFDGDTFVGESHPILKDGILKGGTDKGTVYVDPVTDNERYLNLQTDLKDLSQFDMICFRNYPDQSNEQDEYGVNAKGVVDDYFNLLDKNLFADFLKSLRDAVDTGISLFITNPQLAVDMGFIDTYHEVSDLTGSGTVEDSDEYSPIKLDDPYGDGSETYTYSNTYPGGESFTDAYRNNYHEVVNTLEDLTDDDGFIWTDEIKLIADQSEFGELDRWWSHIEYKDKLQVGDKFLISTTPTYNQTYFATPLDAVRAGKVITKFADTYRFGAVERVNPYRNYATSIAVEPGTVVAGKQIGAKVFISFTDVVGIQQGYGTSLGGVGLSIEHKSVSLATSYWISYAYSVGAITTEQRDNYLADISGQIVDWTTLTSRNTKYWTTDGNDIIGSTNAYGDNDEILTDTADAVQNKKTLPRTRRRKGRAKRVGSTGLIPNFSIIWSYIYPRLSVPVPSINTRALWWLSERLEYTDGIPLRPEAFDADAFMKQPVITGFKTATVAAQAAVAVGAMVETNLRSAGTSISVLPLTATAFFVEKGTFVPAEPATAAARTPQDIRTTTFESDQVVLYLVHVDPILYLREDVIK